MAQDPESFPFVLVANKSDLATRRLSREQLEQWSRAHQCLASFECSALNGAAVREGALFFRSFDARRRKVDDAFLFAVRGCGLMCLQPKLFACRPRSVRDARTSAPSEFTLLLATPSR